jgi:GWxTD domain-containing protein
MKITVIRNILLFGCLIFFASCGANKKVSKNLSYLYNKQFRPINASLFLYQFSEDSARLYYKVPKVDLLFSMNPTNKKFESRLSFFMNTKLSYSGEALDTLQWVDKISEEPFNVRALEGFKSIKLGDEKQFIIELQVTDLNRVKTVTHYLEVDLRHEYNPHRFKIVNATKGELLYEPYISNSDLYVVESKLFAGKSVDGYYYNNEFDLPLPPGVLTQNRHFNFLPYSFQSLDFAENGTLILDFEDQGFISTAKQPGDLPEFTVFKFREHYPYVPTASEMVNAVRYLTNNAEYDKLKNNPDSKKAMDEFWLISGGNVTKAKRLIKIYYNRVQDANLYFAAQTEGWKTDRGLIYLVFGAPDMVQRKQNTEVWTYGESDNLSSYNFTFVRVFNPFTQKDFRLVRDPAYKSVWFLMVDNWRKGRIKEE